MVLRFGFREWNPYHTQSGRPQSRLACREASARRYLSGRPETSFRLSAAIRSFWGSLKSTHLDGWSFRANYHTRVGWGRLIGTPEIWLSMRFGPRKATAESFIPQNCPRCPPLARNLVEAMQRSLYHERGHSGCCRAGSRTSGRETPLEWTRDTGFDSSKKGADRVSLRDLRGLPI